MEKKAKYAATAEPESVQNGSITAAMAKLAIEEDRKVRIEEAKKLIDNVCMAHKVTLSAVVVIQNNQISSQVVIAAIE